MVDAYQRAVGGRRRTAGRGRAARRTGLAAAGAAAAMWGTQRPARADPLTVDTANSPFTVSASVTYDGVTVGVSGSGLLVQTGGVLNVSSSNSVLLGQNAGSVGTYNLSGGTLATQSVGIGSGTGTFNFDGGTLQATAETTLVSNLTAAQVLAGGAIFDSNNHLAVVTQSLTSGTAAGVTDGGLVKVGAGTLDLTGTNTYTGQTVVRAGTLQVDEGSITGRGVTVNGGGTLEVRGNGTVGSVVLSAGGGITADGTAGNAAAVNLDQASVVTVAFAHVGVNGPATVTQTDGTATLTGGPGSLTLGSAAAGSGTYNLNGGTLNTADVSGGAGTSTFNFSGGTLQASGGSTRFLSGLTTANVLDGGAVVDTNGFAVTVGQQLSSGSTNDGGLTKNGAGTLTLAGSNSYAGNTTINAGSLVVTTGGSIGGRNVLLNAGGTLAIVGSGTVTDAPQFDVEGDAGTSAVATVTVAGAAVVNAGPIFLGTTGRASLVQTGGSVQTNELELGINSGSAGTYALSAGTLAAGNLIVGDGGPGVFDQTGGTVDGGSSPVGLGLGQGVTGTYNLSGGTLATVGFYGASNGTSVLNFNGGTLRANGSVTMFLANQSAANVLAGGARIDTAGNDVTVDQPLLHGTTAAIDGGLTKLGAGTLTLTASNGYTGGTNVSAGVVRVNNTAGSGTGPGPVKVSAGATLGGTGTIAGAVTLSAGATVTAGADDFDVGTLTTTGRETWTSDATGQGEYVAKTAGSTTDGSQATDLLRLSALTVAATSAHRFVIDVTGFGGSSPTLGFGQVLVLATDAEPAGTNPFGPKNAAATLATLSLTVTSLQTFDSSNGADLTLSTQPDATGGYDLTVSAPEPTAVLLLAAAGVPLALGRRRRPA